ncbi:MAG TPA: hypothetical protein VFG50_06215 [Rhodothermales bacterium]|nr:hypothetical protein [Rhodothermales bacterium]
MKAFFRITLLIALLSISSAHAQAQAGAAVSSREGTGPLIGVREIRLKPGVDPAEFDRFVRELYNPSREGVFPGAQDYIAKAIRGEKMGTYVHYFIIDSEKTRNIMFPGKEGEPADWFLEIWNKAPKFEDEFNKYVQGGADYFNTYTDYVVLR